MFCSKCGQDMSAASSFCSRCGSALSTEPRPTSTPITPATGQQIGLALGQLDGSRKKPGPKVWLAVATVLLFIVVIVAMNTSQPQTQPPAQGKNVEAAATDSRPKIPPPKFRFYRSKRDLGTAVIVARGTTDEQLKSLLWFFREKVRSHHFKDIGITHPTWEQLGKAGYLSGMISVYRGGKCANEVFSDVEGTPAPCGSGHHESAFYEWGLVLDGALDADADKAALMTAQGTVGVFDYQDHWQLPASLQAEVDTEKKAKEDHQKVEQKGRELFAEQLERNLVASGYDIRVWSPDLDDNELALDSKIFKDTATRVAFLNTVMPEWRKGLCSAGFRTLRLVRGGFLPIGDTYSIGCR